MKAHRPSSFQNSGRCSGRLIELHSICSVSHQIASLTVYRAGRLTKTGRDIHRGIERSCAATIIACSNWVHLTQRSACLQHLSSAASHITAWPSLIALEILIYLSPLLSATVTLIGWAQPAQMTSFETISSSTKVCRKYLSFRALITARIWKTRTNWLTIWLVSSTRR